MNDMPNHSKFGKKLIDSMREMADALETGNTRQLTIRHVRLPADPLPYDARAVRKIRANLRVSQAVFARLLGVSTVLSQSWEQGSRKPSKLACRLLEEIDSRPDYWRRKLRAA
jgi:putative transcriptional regulator